MKRAVCLFLCLLPALLLGQSIKMSVAANGQKLGTATYMHRLNADGSIINELRILLDFQGIKAEVSAFGHYDKTGRPIKEIYLQKDPNGSSKTVQLTYAKSSVSVNTNGKTKKVAIPKNAKLASPSQFWFIKTMPKKGALDKQHTLDHDTLKWKQETTKYVGPEKVKIGSKTYNAHKMVLPEGSIWVDAKGMPVRIRLVESGQVMLIDRV